MKIKFIDHILPIGLLLAIIFIYNYSKDFTGGFIFLIVGTVFLYAGFFVYNSHHRILIKGIKTKAKIIDFFEKRLSDGDDGYRLYHFPIVSFTDKNGIEATQQLDCSENPKKLNQIIDIVYLKKGNEYKIVIDNKRWITYFPSIFISMGFLFLIIGIIWTVNKIQLR